MQTKATLQKPSNQSGNALRTKLLHEGFALHSLRSEGWLAWKPHWLATVQQRSGAWWFDRLLSETQLQPETLVLFGREVLTPRLTAWYGDIRACYTYSKRCFSPKPWTLGLVELRTCVEAAIATPLHGVLLNLYRDGNDAMGWHADDEPELGPSAEHVVVASLSLGARRRFHVRSNRGHERYTYDLGDGDLLVMGGNTQRHYQHRLAKTRRPVGPRLNLTFRVFRDFLR